jgi:hypothetical protein
VVGAGTAFVWATDPYDGYRWWFRIAGLAVVALLVWLGLRRRNQCSLAGIRTVAPSAARRVGDYGRLIAGAVRRHDVAGRLAS